MMFAKMFDSDLAASDVGRSNRIYSEDEIIAIQSVMRNAEQLLEERRRLYELVSRCKVALAPHRKLPEDVLRIIFAFHVQEGMQVPYTWSNGQLVIPAAVVLTHVCSLWRRIALSSPELWNNISLEMGNHDRSFPPDTLELLSRACNLPINLELKVLRLGPGDRDFDFGDALDQLSSIHSIQKLRLHMDWPVHPQFSLEDMLSVGTFNLVRDLDLQLHNFPISTQTDFPNLEALVCHTPNAGGSLYLPGVPWSRLRRLDISTYMQDVPTALLLLFQCTLIEECKLFVVVFGNPIGPKVTLLNLRALKFTFMTTNQEDFDILDTFFSLLSFPTLQSLIIAEEDSFFPSSRVMSPLARNLKLMAPQLHELYFNVPIEDGEASTLSEHMPSLHIAVVGSE
jgi:hypothetical protein